ncbi:MAG: hypothetical protein NTW19_03220 [Planctomycetota bacterium]|nr:hypothetical protein [Planctomycetota bacterium]
MSPALPPTPWGSAPGPSPESLRRRAALLLWALGGVQVVCFGCCSFVLGAFGFRSMEEIQKLLPPGEVLPPGTAAAHPFLIPVAVGVLLVGFFPGVAYIVLGFPVRAGLRGPTIAALAVSASQAAVMAMGVFVMVLGSLAAGDMGSLATSAAMGGGMLVALGVLVVLLVTILRAPGMDDDLETDPWNEPEA